MRHILLSLLVVGSLLIALPTYGQELQTECEESGFTRYTGYESMMDYLVELRYSTTDMRLGVYGHSREGRALPYAIYSRPLISEPYEAAILDRPVVVIAALVHGNEPTLRESLLIMMRDLGRRGTALNDLLEDIVVIVVPQINPDGFLATPRGIRGNAWGLDLNRDYMKLEHDSLQALVGNLLNKWHPHVFVDGHNGGSLPYQMNYLAPTNAAADPDLTRIADEGFFPAIDTRLEAEGFEAFYFSSGNRDRWVVGGHEPRIGRNYAGLANMVGILFESPPGQPVEPAVRSGILAYKAVLEFAAENAEEVKRVVRQARLDSLISGQEARGEVVVDQTYGPEDWTVDYKIFVGQGEARRLEEVTGAQIMKRPIPTAARERPYAYILPRDAEAAVALLKRHNIVVEQLVQSVELELQVYPISEISYETAFNHAAAVRIAIQDPETQTMRLPKDTYVVPAGQALGRVAAHLLEVETTDNVIYWNTMDAWIPKARHANGERALVPIYKLMTPTPLPTMLID